jgi:glutamine---fructose-6-phosphate transaminase (isomerizing)
VIRQNERIAEIAATYAANEHAFFIGRGPMYPVALEGALKLKEISYIHAEGYHAAELKHGPIALLVKGTPVIAIACDIPGKDKTSATSRNAAPAAHASSDWSPRATTRRPNAWMIHRHPALPSAGRHHPAAVALQLLAYHVARIRGCEIDQPRNLAKSVTVE